MHEQYLAETRLLNYRDETIQALIAQRGWAAETDERKIGMIYDFVQNEVKLGYNRADDLRASEVLRDGYGQCNTKAILLMAMLRGVGVPCRLHGSEVSKGFQRGATTALINAFAPERIVHTWVEVLHENEWLALEGVIVDKLYFEAVKAAYPQAQGRFERNAIAVDDLHAHSIDWAGRSVYVQSCAVVNDLGLFSCPDDFYAAHKQHWNTLTNFVYVHCGRKMMNRNVAKMRASLKK